MYLDSVITSPGSGVILAATFGTASLLEAVVAIIDVRVRCVVAVCTD